MWGWGRRRQKPRYLFKVEVLDQLISLLVLMILLAQNCFLFQIVALHNLEVLWRKKLVLVMVMVTYLHLVVDQVIQLYKMQVMEHGRFKEVALQPVNLHIHLKMMEIQVYLVQMVLILLLLLLVVEK